MMNIKLKRILSRKNMEAILNYFKDNRNITFNIQDKNGDIIFGDKDKLYTEKRKIMINKDIIGWICGNEDLDFLKVFFNYIIETEFNKKALGKELLDKYREITLLYDMAEKLVARLEPKEIAKVIIEDVDSLIEADNIDVMFYNEDKDLLETAAMSGDKENKKLVFKPGESIAGKVFLNGNGEIINYVSNDSRFVKKYLNQITSMVCVPLKVKNDTMGLINITSKEYREYTANDLKVLSAIAFQASIALENAKLYKQLKQAYLNTIDTLADTIEKRDPYTGGHTRRVMNYSLAIAETLDFSKKKKDRLQLGALLHDIGKIGVRDNILLNKQGLTNAEYKKMQKHPEYGKEILKNIDYLNDITSAISEHHERFDGNGYPNHLDGENIDLYARIIAVADTFDAMITDRPYRKGLTKEKAIKEIKKNAGTQFDPEIVQAFLTTFKNGNIS